MSISISGDGSITGVQTNYTFDKSLSIAGSALHAVATSGAYADLSGRPTSFSGDYDDLTNKPTLGTAAATAATAYATAAQGSKADANDTDIDDIYTQLVAIGNDTNISTVAQLKTALLALARS